MARVLITGSSDGLGLMAARVLIDDGHAVTLHARNEQRGADAREARRSLSTCLPPTC
jgi:NAD(P)-dependent dehydrogenase (short-subunit alcohol dehydrogenase family)